MSNKNPAQTSAEQQQENPWYVCSECGEPVVIYGGREFKTCACDPMQIVLTPEGVKRGV